jgi:SAM-dependent methyltransferase
MIGVILLVILVLIGLFAFVLMFGAPYLPTLAPQIESALKLANLKDDQIMLELGCGDGRVLIAAAKTGATVIGYELNPLLALIAWLRTRRYGKKVKVVWGNFWLHEWPVTDVVFVFLLDKYMKKLDKICVQYPHKPLKLVSFAFRVPDRHVDKSEKGVFLYIYR